MNQSTPQVLYQPVSSSGAIVNFQNYIWLSFQETPWNGQNGQVFWCCYSSIDNQRYGKDVIAADQSHGSSECSNIGNGIQLTIILSCLGYTLWEVWQIRCHSQFKKIQTHPPIWHEDSTSIVKIANVVTNVVNTLTHSIWIHFRPRSRSRAKFDNEKTFSATERTVLAVYARLSTTERQPDYFQRVACLQNCNSWELVSTDKLVVWQKQI